MEVGEAITQRLLDAGSATRALVSNRVYWDIRKQDDPLPAVVLNEPSPQFRPQNLETFDDMRTARIQVSSYALTKAENELIIEAAINDLVPEASVSDVLFWRADVEGPFDLGGEQIGTQFVRHRVADLIIRYAKAA